MPSPTLSSRIADTYERFAFFYQVHGDRLFVSAKMHQSSLYVMQSNHRVALECWNGSHLSDGMTVSYVQSVIIEQLMAARSYVIQCRALSCVQDRRRISPLDPSKYLPYGTAVRP